MREVAIIGMGQVPVDEQWDKSLREIAGEAVFAAMTDAGQELVDGIFVGNMMSGLLTQQENLGTLIADWVGMRGVEAFKIEAACGSGAAAVHIGVMAVASGMMDTVIAMGVEKMTETRAMETTAALATAADADWETPHGISFVGLNALIMQRYMYEYGWKHADFAPFSINAHANAMNNSNARLHEIITEKDYQHARMIASPINLLDASPTGDGAAAIVLAPAEMIRKTGKPAILLAGSASATDSIAVHSRLDALWLKAAESSAHQAYRQAGIMPKDVDVFELHDAFSIMAALSLEACGFAERGQGPRLALEGEILPGGRIPVATRGGLKARGHPVGATGVYQIIEAAQQLLGIAGANQIPDARIAMTQNIGGSGSNIVTHILKQL
jgi:acetyl-CoA C-acetyltransferase